MPTGRIHPLLLHHVVDMGVSQHPPEGRRHLLAPQKVGHALYEPAEVGGEIATVGHDDLCGGRATCVIGKMGLVVPPPIDRRLSHSGTSRDRLDRQVRVADLSQQLEGRGNDPILRRRVAAAPAPTWKPAQCRDAACGYHAITPPAGRVTAASGAHAPTRHGSVPMLWPSAAMGSFSRAVCGSVGWWSG